MRYLPLLAVAGLVGVTTVACTETTYSSARPQYVYSPGYTATTSSPAYITTGPATYSSPAYTYGSPTYTYGSAYPYGTQYSSRIDRDGDGVRNSQDRRPDNPYRY